MSLISLYLIKSKKGKENYKVLVDEIDDNIHDIAILEN